MSAHVEVISTDFRRVKVKVSPGTYLIDVLREACTKLNLTSDKYLLRYVTGRRHETWDISVTV
jgi:tether containing UBX domain for GLUT4